jgi:glutamate carboxypeptidase
MRAVVAMSLPGTSATIEFDDGYPSMPPTPANQALLDRYSEGSVDLGHGPITPFDPGARGAADVSFVASLLEASMDGLGPHGSGSHTPDESMDLESWPVTMQRAALLIYRLTR